MSENLMQILANVEKEIEKAEIRIKKLEEKIKGR